jgi:glyoxylase I family protein
MIKGFGGIFWRTKNLEIIKKWYSEVLKLEIENWNGTMIKPQLGNETIFLSLLRMTVIFQQINK